MEELPSELDLSEASTASLMSGVAPLPPDSVSPASPVESGVARVPSDGLVSGEIDVPPVPAASSTPVRPSIPSVSSASRSDGSRRGSILQDYFPDDVSDSSCSSMEEEQSLNPEGSEKLVVVEPDSQTVESVAPRSSPPASPVDFTAAAALSLPGSIIRPQPICPTNVESPLQTPQCVLPSSPWEAASSDALSAAGRSEDPALTIQESAMMGSPSCSSSCTVPGALSASLRSNPAPEDGVEDSTEAVEADHPASVEQDSWTGNSQVCDFPTLTGTEFGTHLLSPVVVVISPATDVSAEDSEAVPDSPRRDLSPMRSPTVSPKKQPGLPPHSSPPPSSSPERPVDRPAGTGKLAPADPLLPGSGQHSHDVSATSVESIGSRLDGGLPTDQVELLEDSFLRMQDREAESAPDTQGEEDGADRPCLDVSLEGGVQVCMDRSILEQLRDKAAQELLMWKETVSRMMLNEHPQCSFPHVYGIQNHAEYFRHTEHPAMKPFYDEFHDLMLRNDLTADYVHDASPFTVRYGLARLLWVDAPLPEELLPEMEAVLKRHREKIMDKIVRKVQSIQELDSRLNKLSEPETIQEVVEGSIVSPHRSSGSSPQPVELDQPVDSTPTTEEVKTEEPIQVKTEDQPTEPVKLEDQLLRLFNDHSAPDCVDYPWTHPRFCGSAFQAPQLFCNKGPRIPIWFHGDEQIGAEAAQIPIGANTPMQLVQTALLHQCSEAAYVIKCRVEEIRELERFAVDARAACFSAGAGDLQFALLKAGIAPQDLLFPSVHRETQEMGCQANPSTLSTTTQDGPGIQFIKQNLMDCPLQDLSTEHMDVYLADCGYRPADGEDRFSHSFRNGLCYIGAVGPHFQSVSPISFRTTPDSKIQQLRDQDRERQPGRPFRGVHILAYTEDMYPVVLPTRSERTIISEQLSCTLVELEKPLPAKDSLLSRSEFVRSQRAPVGPIVSESGQSSLGGVQTAVEPSKAAGGTRPIEAVRGGQEMDSCIEVEATPQEPAPSRDASRPLGTVFKIDVPQAAMKPPSGGFLTKAQRKLPPLFMNYSTEDAPHSATESFDLCGDDFQTPEESEELERSGNRQLEMAAATVQSDALNTEGTAEATATMAPVKVSALPAPRCSESGRVLPPCTINCFPVPHPDWEMDVDEKVLNDLLPDDLPVVAGVEGNQTMSLLSVDLQEFLPKEDLPDSQTSRRRCRRPWYIWKW